MSGSRVLLCLAMLTLAPAHLHAQSSTAGTPVAATHLAAESNPTVISDGAGGAFVGFKIAWRSAELPAEVAVGRVLASGGRHPEWSALPPPAGSMLVSQYAPTRILAAPLGRVMSFGDFTHTSEPETHPVRRMEAEGIDPAFGTYTPNYAYALFSALPRSDGGATVLSKVPGSMNCLATIVSPTGTALEQFHPMPINVYDPFGYSGERVTAVPSGGDGAIMVLWAAAVTGLSTTQIDLIAVRLDGNGNLMWDPAYRVVTAGAKDQIGQVMTTDDADGAIVAWQDGRSLTLQPDIYAVRLLPNGNAAPGWTSSGRVVSNAARSQYSPAIERDGAGGAWFAWTDERDTLSGLDIYFTRILANGSIAPGFPPNGAGLCTAAGSQTDVQLARDGSGGCFAVWLDSRDGEVDLYAEHFGASGAPTSGWLPGGNPVCTDGTAQAQPSVAWVSNGRAITAWKDARTGTDIVYAAALDATRGVLDAPRGSPARFALSAGANPSRVVVELRLDAAEAGDVKVTLYDLGGRAIAARVIAGPASATSVRFEGLRPGLYFANATRGGAQASARVFVIR